MARARAVWLDAGWRESKVICFGAGWLACSLEILLTRLWWSYPCLSCPVLSCPVLSCPVLSGPVLSVLDRRLTRLCGVMVACRQGSFGVARHWQGSCTLWNRDWDRDERRETLVGWDSPPSPSRPELIRGMVGMTYHLQSESSSVVYVCGVRMGVGVAVAGWVSHAV
jgi:hypothetical protein